jgi:VanZ like family
MANSLTPRTISLKRLIIYWLPLFFYLGLIFYLSSLSFHLPFRPFRHFDKILHMIEYAILSLLFYRAIQDSIEEPLMRYVSFIAIGSCIFYGILDEYHQAFVPLRISDPYDVLADAIGATLMQGLLYIIFSKNLDN